MEPNEPLLEVWHVTSILWIPLFTPFWNVNSLPLPTSSPSRYQVVSRSLRDKGEDEGRETLRVKGAFSSISDSIPLIITSTGIDVSFDISNLVSPVLSFVEEGNTISPLVSSLLEIRMASVAPDKIFPLLSRSLALNE